MSTSWGLNLLIHGIKTVGITGIMIDAAITEGMFATGVLAGLRSIHLIRTNPRTALALGGFALTSTFYSTFRFLQFWGEIQRSSYNFGPGSLSYIRKGSEGVFELLKCNAHECFREIYPLNPCLDSVYQTFLESENVQTFHLCEKNICTQVPTIDCRTVN